MRTMLKPTFKTVMLAFSASAILAACGGASAPATTAPAITESTAVVAPTEAPVAAPTEAPSLASTDVPAAAPTNTPAAAAAPALPIGDPKEAIVATLRKQLKSGSYRSKTIITSTDGTVEITGEIVPPDRMHVFNSIGGKVIETIYIGDTSWTKTGDTWQESKVGVGQILSQFSDAFVDEMAGTVSDVKLVGPELLNGVPTLVYTYISDLNKATTMKMDSKSVVKAWIRVADGLLVRQEIEGETMGTKSKTVQEVEYDPAIKIEPPV